MRTSPHLEPAMLTSLEAAWREQGAPIVDLVRPGLDEGRMDEITRPLGLRLPREVRLWWSWHDGAAVAEPAPADAREIGPGLPFLSLEEAVELYLDQRRMFADVDAKELRPAHLFPISYATGPVSCDCRVPEGAPSPIHQVHSHDYDIDGVQNPRAKSLGELVLWWIGALRDGTWRWDGEIGRWAYRPDGISHEQAMSGLV